MAACVAVTGGEESLPENGHCLSTTFVRLAGGSARPSEVLSTGGAIFYASRFEETLGKVRPLNWWIGSVRATLVAV